MSLSCGRLVGRRREFDAIAQLATAKRGQALLVVGETGVGKSRLLDAVANALNASATIVRANPAESHWPLSGLSALIASIGDHRAAEFAGELPLRTIDAARPAIAFELGAEIVGLLRRLSLQPTLILIDDIDTMDPLSQAVIGCIAARLTGTGLTIVASATESRNARGAVSFQERPVTLPLAGVPRLRLEPLTLDETRELADALSGGSPAAGAVRIVTERSSGNPRALAHAINSLTPAQLDGRAPLGLPLRSDPAVASGFVPLLKTLTPSQRWLLELLSTAPFTAVAAATSASEADENALHDLIDAGLVRVADGLVSIADPLLRSALHTALDSRARRERHRVLAEAHGSLDEPLEAWHSSFCVPEREWSAELLRAAIILTLRREPAAAVEFAERAIGLGEAHTDTARSLLDLATVLCKHGETELAARYLLRARHTTTTPKILLTLARVQSSLTFATTHEIPSDEIDSCIGLYADADPEEAALLLVETALLHTDRWEYDEARERLAQASAISDPRVGRLAEATEALTELLDAFDGLIAPEPHRIMQWLRRSEPALRLLQRPGPFLLLARMASFRENYAEARRCYSAVVNRPRELEPVQLEYVRFLACENEIRAGDFHRANAAIRSWEGAILPSQELSASRLLIKTWLATVTGTPEQTAELATQCALQASRERNTSVVARLHALQGRAALLAGETREALRLLRLSELVGAPFANPSLMRIGADLVEAYVANGRQADARHATERLEERNRAMPTRWGAVALARARAVTAPASEAAERFSEALAMLSDDNDAYELARTLHCRTSRMRELALHDEAEASLSAAVDAFRRAGADAEASAVIRLVGPPSGRTDAPVFETLTKDEREIVERVRLGHRNKEIADALYVSLRTVEFRLTRIYRKAGVRSRSHLVALLG